MSRGRTGRPGANPIFDHFEPQMTITQKMVVRRCVLFCFIVCVTLFYYYRYWGIVTVPGSIPYGCRPGVAGSSPSTLTTSLVISVPSSSSSNGPSNYSVDNNGLKPWRLRRLGRSKVRSASLVRVLSDENGPSGTESQSLSNRAPPTT